MTLVVYGCDPGTSNPGSALLRRAESGWEILRLPVLSSLEDLLAEFLFIAQSPELHPSVVSFESVAWSLHAKNSDKGHGSGRILESVGAVRLFAKLLGVEPKEITPAEWRKKVTGSGRATKEQARVAVQRRVSGWPPGKIGLNRSDAACIALAGGAGAALQQSIANHMRGAS